MKYLGLDYGAKRIGVSISNADGTIAFPRTTVLHDDKAIAALKEICASEKIEAIVVGDTRTLSGGANPVTDAAEAFARRLAEAAGLPLQFAREAGSTVAVSEAPGEAHDDAAAAAFTLQRYLDMTLTKVRP
jgi:putative Holliday junction resolvase